MIGGGYYVITGQWDWNVVLAGLPYALGATTVIFGKHIDKHDKDQAKGIHTLPVIIGERAARWMVLSLMVAQYLVVAYLVAIGFFSPVVLVVFLALNFLANAYRAFRHPKPNEAPVDLPSGVWPLYFVGFSFVHNRRFGLLFLLGLIGDLVVRAVWPLFVR
jgi:1,4-dihydroxy-2-naphthoate octaprenyltransferase